MVGGWGFPADVLDSNSYEFDTGTETPANFKSRDVAIALEDIEMIARISGRDLVATEAKYHQRCLVN